MYVDTPISERMRYLCLDHGEALSRRKVPARPAVPWAAPGVFGALADHEPFATPTVPVRPDVSAAVADLQRALEALSALDPTDSPELQALVDTDAVATAFEDLRRLQLRHLADLTTRQLHVHDKQPSASLWRARQHPDLPAGDLTLAKNLRRYPVLRSAVFAGQVHLEQARTTVTALDKAAPHVDRPDGLVDGQPAAPVIAAIIDNTCELVAAANLGYAENDPRLTALEDELAAIAASTDTDLGHLEQAYTVMARDIHARRLRASLVEQTDALLPLQLEKRAKTRHEQRSVTLGHSPEDGGPEPIVIHPNDELYELFWTCLRAASAQDPQNPVDTSLARAAREAADAQVHADDAALVYPSRSRAQRLHDALTLVLQRYLAADLAGNYDKAPVRIDVTVSEKQLTGTPGVLPGRGRSGRSLPRTLLRQWWNNATITALVLSRGMIPLGAAHGGRTLKGLERRASHQQHRGCAGQQCCRPDDPLTHLVPHHLVMFSKNGKTSLAETLWVCPTLHHDLHHGKTIQLRDGRWIDENGLVTA